MTLKKCEGYNCNIAAKIAKYTFSGHNATATFSLSAQKISGNIQSTMFLKKIDAIMQ